MRHLAPLLAAAFGLVLASAAEAQQSRPPYDYRNLSFRGVGAEVGWIVPARTQNTVLVGGRADLGWLGPAVRIVPRLTFWGSKLDEGEVTRLADQLEQVCDRQTDCPAFDLGEIRVSDLAIGLDGHYVWETTLGIDTYAGVGGGLHLLNGSGEAIEGTFVEDLLDAITPGVDLVVGAELPMGPLRIFGEARGVLTSDTRYVGVSVGGMVDFGVGARRPRAAAGGAR